MTSRKLAFPMLFTIAFLKFQTVVYYNTLAAKSSSWWYLVPLLHDLYLLSAPLKCKFIENLFYFLVNEKKNMQNYLFYTIIHLSLLNLIGCSYNDVIFPGRFNEEFNTNKGHLKPFGWQRKPEGRIMEYEKILPAEIFYKRHMKTKLPLIYRNAISKSPAITLWDDEYLNSTYGELDVLVELKKENRDFTTGRMRFEKFLRYYKEQQIYIVSLLPTEMMKDVQVHRLYAL